MVEVINTIAKTDMRGMLKEHIITVSLTNEIVQCVACVDNKGLPTNFVLGHAI
jgi:hypothetical protein